MGHPRTNAGPELAGQALPLARALIAFRPLTRAGFELLRRWLEQPHVARWWYHETEPAAVERDVGGGGDGTEPGEDLLALYDGEPVGLVQRSRLDRPGPLRANERPMTTRHYTATVRWTGDLGAGTRGCCS